MKITTERRKQEQRRYEWAFAISHAREGAAEAPPPWPLSAVTVGAATAAFPGQRERTTATKMSVFPNKFGSYTRTQLDEILEDDEKLTKMVLEMEEVSEAVVFFPPVYARTLASSGPSC